MSIHGTFFHTRPLRYTHYAEPDAPAEGHLYFCRAALTDRVRISLDTNSGSAVAHITDAQLRELRDAIDRLLGDRPESSPPASAMLAVNVV